MKWSVKRGYKGARAAVTAVYYLVIAGDLIARIETYTNVKGELSYHVYMGIDNPVFDTLKEAKAFVISKHEQYVLSLLEEEK